MLSETIRTSEQQLNGIRLNSSSQGLPLAIGWGRNRVSGNLIWYGDFRAVATVTSTGGKGGPEFEQTRYTYFASMMFALGYGPIESVPQVYKEKAKFAPAQLGFSVFDGVNATPWPYLTTNHPGAALHYKGVAYVAAGPYRLSDGAGIAPHSFEVAWGGAVGGSNNVLDANPAFVMHDFLTNPAYGVGISVGALESSSPLTPFHAYCAAAGLYFSPLVSHQQEARAYVQQWLDAAGAAAVWSQGRLKIVPYADKAIGAWAPNVQIRWHITPDYMLEPVRIVRRTVADAYNVVRVEFLNRAMDYNKDVAEAQDDASIAAMGARPAPTMTCHFICDALVARVVAQLRLQRYRYVRAQYIVKVPWILMGLEPMDVVSLTDPTLGLSGAAVRVVDVEIDDENVVTLTCEDFPAESGTAATYANDGSSGYIPDSSTPPGSANAPVLFEPPLAYAGDPAVYVATSGGPNWGGCEVWASYDNANYRRVATVNGKARHGVLSAVFPTGQPLDSVNGLNVNLSVSGGSLTNVSTPDWEALANLAWVGGEIVCSQFATLTAASQYQLSNHRRGLFGTPIASRAIGAPFVRLDDSVARIPYTAADIGKTIHVKLVSFNTVGVARQDISTVPAIQYVITGAPPPAISGLALLQPFTGSSVKVKWDVSAGATSYTVQIEVGGVIERTVPNVGTNQYEYTFEDARADGGPWRSLTVRVRADGPTGSSAYTSLSVTNAQAAAPGGITVTATPAGVIVKTDPSADTDFAGMVVHASTTNNFTPAAGNKVYDGPDVVTPPLVLSAGATHFLRIAHYDQFGQDALNYTPQLSVTPQRSVLVVTTLPASGNLNDCVLLTTNMTLYRWNGSAWV